MKGATGRGPAYRRRLAGKTVSVVGLAKSGVAAARLIRRVGGTVLASDAADRAALSAEALRLERDGLRALDGRPSRRGLRRCGAGRGEPGRAAHAPRPRPRPRARRAHRGRARAGLAGDGGRGHRHHRHERQDDHDRAHRRALAGPGAPRARRRQYRHALVRAGARLPGRRHRRGRVLELPAREHRAVPAARGGGAEHHARSPGPARQPRALRRGQGAHSRQPDGGRLRGAQRRRSRRGRPRRPRPRARALVQPAPPGHPRRLHRRGLDRRAAQRARRAHLPGGGPRAARRPQRRERARGDRLRAMDGDGARGHPAGHRRVSGRRPPDRARPRRTPASRTTTTPRAPTSTPPSRRSRASRSPWC